MEWESMGKCPCLIQSCLVISFCKQEPEMNGNIMKLPHIISFFFSFRLVYIVNITSNYPWAYPHIFAIPPFTTHPGNDFADEKTHGGRARVSANVWAEGCGPSARHAGPGELWGWGSLRKKHLWIIVVSCFHNTWCSSIARRKKHTVYGFMHLDMGTSWLLRVFKCWR